MRWFVPILLLLAASCAPARIDGSSEEDFELSYQKVRGSLEPAERTRFEEAIVAIGVDDLRKHSADADPDAASRSVMARLDGKTAEEILREAEALKSPTGD